MLRNKCEILGLHKNFKSAIELQFYSLKKFFIINNIFLNKND